MSDVSTYGVSPAAVRSYLSATGWSEQLDGELSETRTLFTLPADDGDLEVILPKSENAPCASRLIRGALETIAGICRETPRGAAGIVAAAWLDRHKVARTVPDLGDITTAWHSLPAEMRDRIGIIATDMVFQGFVHGDAYVAADQLEDLPVYDEDVRTAAFKAEDARLNELHRFVEAALPDLFGRDENPAWSENPGKTPTPAARAWAAKERAERAAGRERREAEMEAEDAAVENMRERCAALVEEICGPPDRRMGFGGAGNEIARRLRALPICPEPAGHGEAAHG